MITCLKYDSVNNKLWYGTTDSQFQCLNLTKPSNISGAEMQPSNAKVLPRGEITHNEIEVKGKLILMMTEH
jgi:hypothetical protein